MAIVTFCGFVCLAFSSPVIFGRNTLIAKNPTHFFRGAHMSIRSVASAATNVAVKYPHIIYGTAWKKERTEDLVYLAIKNGFRAIDTACQPKHYAEAGVGEGLRRAYADGIVSREDMFLQTKFTSLDGQDPARVPYTIEAELEDQVRESLNVSLSNLGTEYLDSLVLHSPMRTFDSTARVWRVFEEFVAEGRVRALGLSNTYDLRTLQRLYDLATVKPTYLQNRFYAKSGYDTEIREFCREKGINYESFWTLTANPHVIDGKLVRDIASKYGATPQQIFFKFVRSLGIIPLSGTTSERHMVEDVAVESIPPLSAEEVSSIERALLSH